MIGRLSRIDPVTNEVTLAGARPRPVALLRRGGRRLRLGGDQPRRHGLEAGRARRRCEQHQARRERQGARLHGRSRLGGGRGGGSARPHRSDDRHDAAVRLGHDVMGSACMAACWRSACSRRGKDVTADLKGRIAVVALPVDDLDATSTDPLGTQFAFNAAQVQFHYATCAKLFNYPGRRRCRRREARPGGRGGLPRPCTDKRADIHVPHPFRLRLLAAFARARDGGILPPRARALSLACRPQLRPAARARRHRRCGGLCRGKDASRLRRRGARRDARHPPAPPSRRPARATRRFPRSVRYPSTCRPFRTGCRTRSPRPAPTTSPIARATCSCSNRTRTTTDRDPRRLDAIVYRVGIEAGRRRGQMPHEDRSTTSRDRTPPSPRHTVAARAAGLALSPDCEQLDGSGSRSTSRERRSRTLRSVAPSHMRSIVAGSRVHSTAATSSCRQAPCFPPTFVALRDPRTHCARPASRATADAWPTHSRSLRRRCGPSGQPIRPPTRTDTS